MEENPNNKGKLRDHHSQTQSSIPNGNKSISRKFISIRKINLFQDNPKSLRLRRNNSVIRQIPIQKNIFNIGTLRLNNIFQNTINESEIIKNKKTSNHKHKIIKTQLKKLKIKTCRSTEELFKNSLNKFNFIDLMHEKQIQLCLNLIKYLPESETINYKNEENNSKINNLIHLIKNSQLNTIYNQSTVNKRLSNDSNMNSDETRYRNNLILTTFKNKIGSINNKTTRTNLNISNISIKNNLTMNTDRQDSETKYKSQQGSLKVNDNITIPRKDNFIKIKILKLSEEPKDPNVQEEQNDDTNKNKEKKIIQKINKFINFRTGFVRNTLDVPHGKEYYQLNNKSISNETLVDNYRKKKEKSEKLSKEQIDEYKSIIKYLDNNSKTERIHQKKNNFNDININDNNKEYISRNQTLRNELSEIYRKQKMAFFRDIQNGPAKQLRDKMNIYYGKVNSNIDRINSIQRNANRYVDGYSVYSGRINKLLNDFNHVLGNKFHGKEQKKKKKKNFSNASKIMKIN